MMFIMANLFVNEAVAFKAYLQEYSKEFCYITVSDKLSFAVYFNDVRLF